MAIVGDQMIEKRLIAEARRNLSRLICEAERGKAFELTRRGDPVAVLVGHQAYKRLAACRCRFREAYRDFKTAIDLAEINLDPDELFADARDTPPGREFRFES